MVKFVKNAKISDKILRLKYSPHGVERFNNIKMLNKIKLMYTDSVRFKFEQMYELENSFEDLFQKYGKINRT